MRRPGKAVALLAGLAAVFLAGCGASGVSEAEANASGAPAGNPGNPLEIEIDEELMKRIRTGEPRWAAVSGTLRVAGQVEADETRMARINAPVTGRIVELNVIEGQQVEAGQVLATLHSTELTGAQSAFLRALTQHGLADRAVTRARQLLEAGVIGSAELQRREAELQQAATDLISSREQLRILGMPEAAREQLEKERTVDSHTQVLSTISGRVIERLVTPGQVVQAAEVVCVVADLSNVWLVADIPEQSAGAIRVGQTVQAEMPALPGHRITGKISFVSAMVNPETRTVRARMDLPNPERKYRPAMLATMILVAGTERRLVVPSTAIVRDGDSENVFVQTGPRTFLLRKVVAGPESGGDQVLIEGLDEDTKIVTEGAFHLNNERRRRSVSTEG
jgi:cobalt-zinc-cadmium efflux system membrane fusion protein